MFYRLLFFLFSPLALIASCIPQDQTESKEGVVYALGSTVPFEGCVEQFYPDGRKESEIVYRSGKIHTKKLWNTQGYLYTFERYKDGALLQPIEMSYHQAIDACQQASFGGYRDWQLPNVQELYKVPFSEATKEMTFMASNPPVKIQNNEEVSYVRFGATPKAARWDNDDLAIERILNVVCIREGKPHVFHLIMGLNGIADLASRDMDEYIRVAASRQAAVTEKKSVKVQTVKNTTATTPRQPPVAKQKRVVQKPLRPGYYINIYTFSEYPPEETRLKKILLGGYRYTFNEITYEGEKLTRVLVGPFPDEKKARKELKRVHLTIEPDAYILDKRN